MWYLFAVLLPPIAVLFTGRPVHALINLVLTLCLWIPGVLHAVFVISRHQADRHHDKLIEALQNRSNGDKGEVTTE